MAQLNSITMVNMSKNINCPISMSSSSNDRFTEIESIDGRRSLGMSVTSHIFDYKSVTGPVRFIVLVPLFVVTFGEIV